MSAHRITNGCRLRSLRSLRGAWPSSASHAWAVQVLWCERGLLSRCALGHAGTLERYRAARMRRVWKDGRAVLAK